MQPWFGLHLPSYTHPDVPPAQLFDRVVQQAKAAEESGFRLVSVMDGTNVSEAAGRCRSAGSR